MPVIILSDICFWVISKKNNPEAFDDLLKYILGAISLGETFSTIHGDLVTEHFNKKSKGTTETYRSGYISGHSTVNKWIVTSHIHSKLPMIQQENWNYKHLPSIRKKQLVINECTKT